MLRHSHRKYPGAEGNSGTGRVHSSSRWALRAKTAASDVSIERALTSIARDFSFEFVDLFHVFPPEQMSALLCIPESGSTPPVQGAGEFFNRHYGDFCTGADTVELILSGERAVAVLVHRISRAS